MKKISIRLVVAGLCITSAFAYTPVYVNNGDGVTQDALLSPTDWQEVSQFADGLYVNRAFHALFTHNERVSVVGNVTSNHCIAELEYWLLDTNGVYFTDHWVVNRTLPPTIIVATQAGANVEWFVPYNIASSTKYEFLTVSEVQNVRAILDEKGRPDIKIAVLTRNMTPAVKNAILEADGVVFEANAADARNGDVQWDKLIDIVLWSYANDRPFFYLIPGGQTLAEGSAYLESVQLMRAILENAVGTEIMNSGHVSFVPASYNSIGNGLQMTPESNATGRPANSQTGAALHLLRSAEAPIQTWDFESSSEFVSHHLSYMMVGSILDGQSTGNDPYVLLKKSGSTDINVDANKYTRLLMRVYLGGNIPATAKFSLYMYKAGIWTARLVEAVPGWNVYDIDLPALFPDWSGSVQKFRLDFVGGLGFNYDIKVDHVQFIAW